MALLEWLLSINKTTLTPQSINSTKGRDRSLPVLAFGGKEANLQGRMALAELHVLPFSVDAATLPAVF